MQRRILAALLLSVLVLLPLQGAQAGHQASHARAGQVTLRFATYAFDPWSKIFPKIAATYMAEHPNVKVETIVSAAQFYPKIQAEAVAHQGVPDVFIMDPQVLAVMADRGILMPLDSFVKTRKLDLTQYWPNAITDSRYNKATRTIGSGDLYAMPLTNDQDELFFNQTAFDKAHLAYPHEGSTWAQVRDMVIKLTLDKNGRNPAQAGFDAKHIVQYGLNGLGDRQILEIIQDFGGAVIGPDYKHSVIDQTAAKTAISWLADLYKMHVIPQSGALAGLGDAFIAGKVAVSLDGNWQVDYYVSTIRKFTWDIAPVPTGPRGTPYVIGDSNSWSMYAHTQHPNEAWDLLSWLAVSEAMTKYSTAIGLPGLKSAQAAWGTPKRPAHRGIMSKYMQWTHNNQEGLHEAEWRAALGQNLQAVWLGRATPEQGAKTTAAAIDRILQSP